MSCLPTRCSLSRPTKPAHFWEDAPHILGGRDEVRGGTWLGVNKSNGRFAFLTNYREVWNVMYVLCMLRSCIWVFTGHRQRAPILPPEATSPQTFSRYVGVVLYVVLVLYPHHQPCHWHPVQTTMHTGHRFTSTIPQTPGW